MSRKRARLLVLEIRNLRRANEGLRRVLERTAHLEFDEACAGYYDRAVRSAPNGKNDKHTAPFESGG